METLKALLAENPLFHDLDPAHLEAIMGCASNVAFEPGHLIFRAGESASQFYVVREGRVALEVFRLDVGSLILQTLGAGDVLGCSWLVPPHKWQFDARCQTRVRAFSLDGACIRAKCDADPSLGYALVVKFAMLLEQRLQATRLQLFEVREGPVEPRPGSWGTAAA